VSKAFTRESDDSGAKETPLVRRQLPPGTRNFITRNGADRLRQRIAKVIEERAALASSRSGEIPGDDQALRRKMEAEIRTLQEILNSVVIAEPPADPEKVGFGASVVVRYASGEEEAFRIVGVEEADPESGSISWLSPLAKALLSRRTGKRVKFREQELTVVRVEY